MSGRNVGKSWGPRTWRRGALAAALATTCVPLAVVAVPGLAEANAGTAPAIFHGSAAAYGVRVTYLIDGVPLTKTPFDGGGPTAQAVVDSGLGSSTGYAASPDPGELFASGPGLVAGVLGGGVPGVLPPVTGLPSPPEYPFLVRSDANTNPQVAAGQAPVTVSAKSQPTASQSQATFGVDSSGGGGGGAVSTASVDYTPNGAGSAAATADLQGVTAGPLTLGHVLSKVSKTLKPDGTIVPSTTLEISGATISGTPVEFGPDSFSQLNGALKSVLAQSGVVVEFVAAQEFPESGRIIAPGVRISMPIPQSPQIPGVGQFSGTATYFIGFATAEITPPGGIPTSSGTAGGVTPNSTGSNSTGPSALNPAGTLPTTVDSAGSPLGALMNVPTAGGPLPGAVLSGASASAPSLAGIQSVAAAEFNGKDVRSVYLLAVAAVVAAIAAGLRIVRPGGVK
jgi:hypothetical protein